MFCGLFCNHYLSHVQYNYIMIKFEWLAADILLIPSCVGLVSSQIFQSKINEFIKPMGR